MFNGYPTEEHVKDHIEALLRELAGYESVGDDDSAKAVKDQLRAFGYRAAKPQEQAEKRGPGRPRKSA